MKKMYIDGSAFDTEQDFHEFMAKEFDFPADYAKNVEALRGCLTTGVVGPFEIKFDHFDYFSDCIGAKTAKLLLEMFQNLEKERKDDFKFTLKN